MGEVVNGGFGLASVKRELGWMCGCGSSTWLLFANGEVVCTECNCITTILKVVKVEASDR
jgi:hypothetical protein